MAEGDGDRRVAVEGELPRRRLVQHHAEGVEVRLVAHALAPGLLRREVLDRAEHRPRLGDRGGRQRTRDPEVGDLDRALRGDEDVLGLDVPVDDPHAVRVVQDVAHLGADPTDLLLLQRARPPEERLEVLALHVLHDDEVHVAVASVVVDLDHVGVGQPREGLGFPLESGHELGVVGVLLPQDLDGDRPTVREATAPVHERHPALAQRGEDLVLPFQHAPDHRLRPPGAPAVTSAPSCFSPGRRSPVPAEGGRPLRPMALRDGRAGPGGA